MKILLSLMLFFLSIGSVFAASEPGTYAFYLDSVDNFCKPTDSTLWADWKTNSLIKIEQVKYANITNKNSDQDYKNYLKSLRKDESQVDLLGIGIGPKFLEKASYVYKETMGSVYACAVMNAKIRITDNLISNIPTTQSNLKNKLQNQLSNLRRKIETDGCREVGNTTELSIKKALLDNTTYQYCNYRQYLYYLDMSSKQNMAEYMTGGTAPKNTDSASQEMARSGNKISAEIAHTKEVYPQAMVAFTEFEKTYASHIILEFILQDYIELRSSLRSLLNPIGQVIYKASNKQKQ
ncbi:MAG: hypothetical protein PHH70_00925 [Candidatus Gracilibacteria bacterium]|nr:hypothetical protein [Candidatus Gracilibacteria bacterium]